MGEATSVNPGTVPAKQAVIRPQGARSFFAGMDIIMLLVVVTLLIFGLLMVYSSSWNYSMSTMDNPAYMVGRQMLWAALGVTAALVISRFNYHILQNFLLPIMAVTVVLLLAVLVIGETRFNATRTLFWGSLQPSELAKIATIIYLSFWLNAKKDHLHEFSLGLFPMAIILGFLSGLVLLEPDISASFTLIVLGGTLFFVAGGDLKQTIFVVVVVALLAWIVVTVTPTGSNRIGGYLKGLNDLQEAPYHVLRAAEAIMRGGWFGVGIGNSSTKITGLPVPWNDSIYAVIAEETGLLGAIGVMGLYIVFLWRGLKIAENAPDHLGKLLVSGITIWISMEAMLNMGGLLNIIPFSGNALPLISAGGSSLVTIMLGIGLILSVSRHDNSAPADTLNGRNYSAVVDLRWRDGRRRVPRARRPSSHQE